MFCSDFPCIAMDDRYRLRSLRASQCKLTLPPRNAVVETELASLTLSGPELWLPFHAEKFFINEFANSLAECGSNFI